ncbi:MAG: isopentenyl phosphate kinase [Candidatus Thermoplasmatota archaeon]
MSAKPTLVKLGGSLLTDKKREQAFRPLRSRRLLGELSHAGPLVLVHGAGSFGHPQVKRAKAALARPGPKQELAVATVLESLRLLRANVAQQARKVGLDLAPINLDGRGLNPAARKEVHAALAAGRIPVLHGTLVRDGATWRVLGGDEIMAGLARILKPRAVLFATDVQGIYDRDPKTAGARLLAETKGAQAADAGRGADVTGRMVGKVAWAAKAAKVAPTWILGGHIPGRLKQASVGTPVGTRILP